MTLMHKKNATLIIAAIVCFSSVSSCLTPEKLDKFVAEEYNNQLPKSTNKTKDYINVIPTASDDDKKISRSVHKTDKFLPLIIYWKYDHRHFCSLNPAIPIANFSNAINALATKKLTDKLDDRRLELTVEQAPASFSIVVKENLIWLVYAFSWAKVYIEPDRKDLVVSYKLIESGKTLKTGKISVKNADQNQGLRWFQSWKSATSEYLSAYKANFTNMTKLFVNQLSEEM
ncbi:MAG: hypothetical protein EAY75_16940 [Bacteroidetes bacterium]|nr:MAG: hypothetical protein EAY75_16940 [Bacteroidota bacterium]